MCTGLAFTTLKIRLGGLLAVTKGMKWDKAAAATDSRPASEPATRPITSLFGRCPNLAAGTREQLMSIEHNPGFSADMFAELIAYLRRVPDREFGAYGASQQQITRMREVFDRLGGQLKLS